MAKVGSGSAGELGGGALKVSGAISSSSLTPSLSSPWLSLCSSQQPAPVLTSLPDLLSQSTCVALPFVWNAFT